MGAGVVAMDPQLFITASFVGLVIVLAIIVAAISVVGSRTDRPHE
jgi:membrane protein DedA with SNARE-associated domain